MTTSVNIEHVGKLQTAALAATETSVTILPVAQHGIGTTARYTGAIQLSSTGDWYYASTSGGPYTLVSAGVPLTFTVGETFVFYAKMASGNGTLDLLTVR